MAWFESRSQSLTKEWPLFNFKQPYTDWKTQWQSGSI